MGVGGRVNPCASHGCRHDYLAEDEGVEDDREVLRGSVGHAEKLSPGQQQPPSCPICKGSLEWATGVRR